MTIGRSEVGTARPAQLGPRTGSDRGIRALDGVRALAVAAVLADHGGVPGLGGGFIGVDIFFVLSGFLITSLLLAEHRRTGRIDLAGFWTRRARRLLPALAVMVVVVVLGRDLFPPDAVTGLRLDALAALAWVANWRFETQRTDYFSQGGTPSPLQHTWSLGVEEQYYLVWPLLLVALGWLLLRRGKAAHRGSGEERWRWTVAIVASSGAAAAAIAAVALSAGGDLPRVYFGTDTRAQALLIGAAVGTVLARSWPDGAATAPRRSRPGLAGVLAVLGLLGLAAAAHLATGRVTEFRLGVLTAVALAAAALIAGVTMDQRGLLARVLATGPLVWLGRISYGVYLWHWPVFLVATGERTGMVGLPLFLLRCLITLALATGSWFLVETPIRRWRPVPARILPAVAAAVAVAAVVVLVAAPALPGRSTAAADDLPPDVPASVENGPITSADLATSATGEQGGIRTGATGKALPTAGPATARSAPAPARAPSSTSSSSTSSLSTSSLSTRPSSRSATAAPPHRDPNGPFTVDVFGDSIAWTLMRYLPPTPGVTFNDHTALGCGVVQGGPYRYFGDVSDQRPECDAWPTTWAAQVAHDHPDEVLLLVGRWETMDRKVNGAWTHVGEPAFDALLSADLHRAFDVLRGTGARLVVATEPYNRRGEQPDGSLYPEDDPARVDRWNELLHTAVAGDKTIRTLDLHTKLSPDGRYTPDVDGLRVRSDGVHLTPAGVDWLTPWLLSNLRADLS